MNALLVLLFRRISADKTVSYTLIGIAEILAVAVPAMLYNSLRPKDECKTGFYFSADKTSVVILTSIAMTFGAMAISTLSAHIGLTGGKETVLENVSLPALDARLGQILYATVTVALVPAVCEEFLCRVVIYREYEKYGPIAAITVSAFAFAFLHFSLGKFPMYIFLILVFEVEHKALLLLHNLDLYNHGKNSTFFLALFLYIFHSYD
jgi:membrane protease YdiL (CAAX protease family)